MKILLLIIVKEVIHTLYWICRELCRGNRKKYRWLLAGGSSILTVVAYLIFWKCGFKYPIVWTILTSCMWMMLCDFILPEEKDELPLAGMSFSVLLVSILMQKQDNRRGEKSYEKDKLPEG